MKNVLITTLLFLLNTFYVYSDECPQDRPDYINNTDYVTGFNLAYVDISTGSTFNSENIQLLCTPKAGIKDVDKCMAGFNDAMKVKAFTVRCMSDLKNSVVQTREKLGPAIAEKIFHACLNDISCFIDECNNNFPDDVMKSVNCLGEMAEYPKTKYPNTKWKILGSTSKMDDSKQVSIALYAESQISENTDTSGPMLAIVCRQNKTEVFIVTNVPANPEYGLYEEYTVRIRFDDEKPLKQRWAESTDNKALFAPNPIAFAKKINKTEKMLFEFAPFQSGPEIIEFDVRELEPYLKILANTCNWKL